LETSTTKILQLENENQRLLKQLASLHDENKGLDATSKTTKPHSRRIANGISNNSDTNGVDVDVDDLEPENARPKSEVRTLQTRLAALRTTSDNYSALETRTSLLELENKRLLRKVESCQRRADKVESLERENGRLIAELEEAAVKAKKRSDEVAELESEKRRLEQSVQPLEKDVSEARLRVSQLEGKLSSTQTEKDRLERLLAEQGDNVAARSDDAGVKCEDVSQKAPSTDSDRCDVRYILQ